MVKDKYIPAKRTDTMQNDKYGAGFVGLELTSVAAGLRYHVTDGEAAPRLMDGTGSGPMSRRFLNLQNDLGTTVHLGPAVTDFTSDGISMPDDTEIAAEIVLVACGARTKAGLADTAGPRVENGFVVDVHCLTDGPAISAPGDCTVCPDRATGRRLRLQSVETVKNAQTLVQARERLASDPVTPAALVDAGMDITAVRSAEQGETA